MKKLHFLLLTVFACTTAAAQPFQVSIDQYTAEQLVTDVLIDNPCVVVSNVASSTGSNFGSSHGIGHFVNLGSGFPLASGLVLTTGQAMSISLPDANVTLGDGTSAWPGDPQLTTYMQSLGLAESGTYFNASSLEFDFVSQNDYMSFNFLFASEEYGTFQCTFSDAFAFFLTDTDTGETTNIALVPGTTQPVSVITVRDSAYNNGCPSVNPQFFGVYSDTGASMLEFNGHTQVMTASSSVVPGKTYHVKMVIADRNDASFDSAVFIEAGSFNSGTAACMDRLELMSFIDLDNDGVKNSEEPYFSGGTFNVSTNGSGAVNLSVPDGTHHIYGIADNSYDVTYAVHPELSTYLACTTAYADVAPAEGSGTTTLLFPVQVVQEFSDVSVSIIPVGPPIAGADYTNAVVVFNHGLTPANGVVTFTPPAETPVLPTSEMTFNVENLLPYEMRSFNIGMHCPPVPEVTMGAPVTATAQFTAAGTDLNPENNSATLTSIVAASYDPNDKTEMHGPEILITDFGPTDQLYYTIRFENLGTATAFKVRIEDMLDSRIEENSVRMVSASHNYTLERNGHNLVWDFEGINLLPSQVDQEMAKGHLTFRARLKPGIEVGDIIENTAHIFFDSNPVIITNTWQTEFVDQLGVASATASKVMLYPNPAGEMVYVMSEASELKHVMICDMLGKTVATAAPSGATAQVSVAGLAPGVYLMRISTVSGDVEIRKFIKK